MKGTNGSVTLKDHDELFSVFDDDDDDDRNGDGIASSSTGENKKYEKMSMEDRAKVSKQEELDDMSKRANAKRKRSEYVLSENDEKSVTEENGSSDTNVQDQNKKQEEGQDQKEKASEEAEEEEQVKGVVEKDEKMIGHLKNRQDCLHDVALPPNYDGEDPIELVKQSTGKPMAKTYPFVLDAFQQQSVQCLEWNQSVLVSAHTSAGKTAIAEYAIAKSLRDGSKVIYTSPIKALSNQKFRELTEEFQDVGLMTGDITMNPNASCIVMTTEILRSMLYRGAEILNEVSWVIFDEVHYMRDRTRGVVWEETMILLPNTVRYVFLSATIPNAMEFAGWIAKLKGQPVHVVYTDYRPTPLQHYVYKSGNEGIHLVVDEKGKFRTDNFKKAIEGGSKDSEEQSQSDRPSKKRKTNDGGSNKDGKSDTYSDLYKILRMTVEKSYQPVIVFQFNRRECETAAIKMSKLDLNEDNEKSLIEEVFTNAIDSLSEDDKKLPQVLHMLPLLKKGIGIHHSGLLPIIKEVIEILFQEGLVKILFATETFAMGLNMPARTVIFTSIVKFDGIDFRLVTSGEYIQMSGRAGRRGIDDRGIVIVIANNDPKEKLDEDSAKKIMSGKADSLNSSFMLSYYMVLNLLRVEEITPQYIMERSFFQYQSERKKPIYEQQVKEIQTKLDDNIELKFDNETSLNSYYTTKKELIALKQELRSIVFEPIHIIQFLNPGRLFKLRTLNDSLTGEDSSADEENYGYNGWGILISFKKIRQEKKAILENESNMMVDLFVYNKTTKMPEIKTFNMQRIEVASTVKLYINKNLKTKEEKKDLLERMKQIIKRFKTIPLMDPVEDMKIENSRLNKMIKKIASNEEKLLKNTVIHENPNKLDILKRYHEKVQLEEQQKELKNKIKESGQLILKEELKRKMRVLRRLNFANSDNVIETKGKVACEVSAGDELVVTELMFSGAFNDLSAAQLCALMSCFIFIGKSKVEDVLKDLPNELLAPYRKLQESAKRVAQINEECKLDIDVKEYVEQFNPSLMEVVYAWCNGAKFYDICKMTDIFEGNIVHMMRRLEELLRQLCVASKTIGDDDIEKKFMEGITLIKRDIVFSSSLYL